MNTEPDPSGPQDFEHELEMLREVIRRNLHRLSRDPLLGIKLDFWLESAQFTAMNLEIWEDAGNRYKYDVALERMQKVLDVLEKLIDQLGDEPGEETH